MFLEEFLDSVFKKDGNEREQCTRCKAQHGLPGEDLGRRRQLMQRLARLNEQHRRQGHASERAEKERSQWHVENRRANVDEPIGQDGRDAKEYHEPQEIIRLGLDLAEIDERCIRRCDTPRGYLSLPFDDPLSQVLQHDVPTEQFREEITEASAQRRAQADEEQRQWKRIEEAGQNAQKYRAWDGKRLQARRKAKYGVAFPVDDASTHKI